MGANTKPLLVVSPDRKDRVQAFAQTKKIPMKTINDALVDLGMPLLESGEYVLTEPRIVPSSTSCPATAQGEGEG